MGALNTVYTLTWHTKLCEGGYTCHELRDEGHRRWGWIINAASTGWDAHVGDFGQAASVGQTPPPVTELIRHFDKLNRSKSWVEQQIADTWRLRSSE